MLNFKSNQILIVKASDLNIVYIIIVLKQYQLLSLIILRITITIIIISTIGHLQILLETPTNLVFLHSEPLKH